MGASICRKRDLEIPAESSAENIIVDFRINIVHPTTEVLYSPGPSFDTLKKDTTLEIQNKLTELITNIDLKAPKIYKYVTNGIFSLFFIVFITLIILFLIGGIFIIFGIIVFVILFISFILYNCWVAGYCDRWSNKVLPVILNYVKNEFKKVYSPMIDIHILYPIKEYRIGRRHRHRRRNTRSIRMRGRQQILVAHWIVVRITNGPIQQPINGPVYWSSNGTILQPEIGVVDMTSEQLPLMMQIQQEQQTPNEDEEKEEQQTEFVSGDIVTSGPVVSSTEQITDN